MELIVEPSVIFSIDQNGKKSQKIPKNKLKLMAGRKSPKNKYSRGRVHGRVRYYKFIKIRTMSRGRVKCIRASKYRQKVDDYDIFDIG